MKKSIFRVTAIVLAMVLILATFASCGQQGPAGPQGEQGIQGEPGVNGTNGVDGKSAYELAVEKGYTGTVEEWLASLVGEVGMAGQAGANGQSAYEIAVKNGYTGTETEWLASLIGAAGTNGSNGSNGTNGKSAYELACDNGFDGSLSEWLDSLVGKDGVNGTNGSNGTNGEDGAKGEKGDKGDAGRGIKRMWLDENLHLWVEYDDGSAPIDLGYVGVTANDPTIITYTVTFVDHDGSELKKETVESGKSATAPADPTRTGYVFNGWDKEFGNITENLTVTAQYQEITVPAVIVHNVNANVGDETVNVVISLLNNPGISSMKLSVLYGDELTLQNVAFDSAYGAYVTAPFPYNNPQSITFISPLVEISANGTFATLTFSLSDSITKSTTVDISVIVDQENTYDEDFVEVAFATVNGKVTIN